MISGEDRFTLQQAYAAMYMFLEREYERTGWDDLSVLLASMALLKDGDSADAAMWELWVEVAEKALTGDYDIDLHLT